jgi:hypothetical protein
VRAAIDAALERPSRSGLSIEDADDAAQPVVRYRVRGAPAGTLVCGALTESGLVTRVGGGENAGRELAHGSVVRELLSRPLGTSMSGELRFKPSAGTGHARRIVVFLQDPKTLEILAASALAI